MTLDQIHRIVSEGLFPGTKSGVSLLETHISWIILSDDFAFKIKKPLRFDFLDFSTLELRRHFCAEELRLNQRLAPQMYVAVLPVSEIGIGDTTLPAVEYALQMHRMDNSREMDKRLLAGNVSENDLASLALLLSTFHQRHRLPADHPYQLEVDAHDFADLFAFEQDLSRLPVIDAALMQGWASQIPPFLKKHAARQSMRIQSGFWVEGHGDLHTRNIFLPENAAPIVFDCLEFNPHLRRMDVLNELAFLCMDLEFYGRTDLSDAFLKRYQHRWACIESPEDLQLFTYFKAYRANVRLKVALLELRQHPNVQLIQTAQTYWTLLKGYVAIIL